MHDCDGKSPTGGAFGFGRRITTGRDAVDCATQNTTESLFRAGNSPRNRHFGTVKHDGIWQVERGPDHSEWHRRIEHDVVGAKVAR